jgi:Predicted beta-xylosidase
MKKLVCLILVCCIGVTVMSFNAMGAPSPVVSYDFNDVSGSVLRDTVNGKDAKIFGTREVVPGIGGDALRLKGGYVLLPPELLNGLTDGTISFWCKPIFARVWTRFFDIGRGTDNYISLFSRRDAAGQPDGSDGAKYHTSVEVKVNGEMKTPAVPANVSADYYNFNEWQHFAVTVSSGALKVYRNGNVIIDVSVGNAKLSDFADSTNSYIARSQFLADADLNAAFDNFMVYDTALSAGDVSAEYTAGAALIPAAPTEEYPAHDNVVVSTIPGEKPTLPQFVNVLGAKTAVVWDDNDKDPNKYSGMTASYTVSGTTEAVGAEEVTATVNVNKNGFSNPLITHTAGGTPDPFITYQDGYYYFCRQQDGFIRISRSKRLQDIESAPRVLVSSPTDTGIPSSATKEWWAPELFFIDGDWYIYMAADDGNNANHRMYVWKNDVKGDALSHFTCVGMVRSPSENPFWAIDATVIQDSGKLYFVWSGWPGTVDVQQNIYISAMESPTQLSGGRVLLSTPFDTQWEQKSGDNPRINEGPQIAYKDGKIYIFYSACPSWNDWYQLGVITADSGDDLSKASSWTKKTDGPVFMQSTDMADKAMSTGHASIVETPTGEYFLVYHSYDTSGGGWANRSARAQRIEWTDDDMFLGNPVPWGVHTDGPSDTPDIPFGKFQAEDAVISGDANVVARSSASGGQAVDLKNGGLTFNVTVPTSGLYSFGIMANAFSDRSRPNIDFTVNGKAHKARLLYGLRNNSTNCFMPGESAAEGGEMQIYLTAGANTIEFAGDGRACLIDYIKIVFNSDREMGDVNADGSVALDDVSLALSAAAGRVTLDASDEPYADMDSNNEVSASDALQILKKVIN